MQYIQQLIADYRSGSPRGIYSCCSANGYVLQAAMKRAKADHSPLLIESTANQVNQFGGYTGMDPAAFRDYVYSVADTTGLDHSLLILGGDHLGPLTWTALPESEAMKNAADLIRAYVLAGYAKIHIDTSMRLADDDPNIRLSDATIARRGAFLARVAEDAYASLPENARLAPPVYVIGSEVPIPGGAQEAEDSVQVTTCEDCVNTVKAFREAFDAQGLSEEVWQRVVGVVVQPGVEFGTDSAIEYDSNATVSLRKALDLFPNLCFEGHSTDYQTPQGLHDMVRDGILILKVGPALTFALREALFALEAIEKEMFDGVKPLSGYRSAIEAAMLEAPGNWQKHYHGNGLDQRYQRAFSFSDRQRYYVQQDLVRCALDRLIGNFKDVTIPLPLLSQYMHLQYSAVRSGRIPAKAEDLILDYIDQTCIDGYMYAAMQK